MSDRTGLAEALLGLDGFRVLEVTKNVEELVIDLGTDDDASHCNRVVRSNATVPSLATPATN